MKYLFLLLALLLASCASPAKLRGESITKPVASGDYQGAIDNIEKNKNKLYHSGDVFLLEFDLGLLYHYSQNYRESIKHLANAEQILDDLYTRSLTNEAAALLTNDNVRPYRSYPFEEQWLHKIQILNYHALGEIDGAVVQSRRALLAIQALQEKEEEKFNESKALRYLIALSFERQKSKDDTRIAYNNAGVSQIPQNEQEIIVIGYAGISPVLGENKFWGTYAPDGALFLRYKDANGKQQTTMLAAIGLGGGFTGRTMTIQFAIPKMVERVSQTSGFSVNVDGIQKRTEEFSNTKSSLEKDLENGQATMLLRTAGRVIARTIAANKAKDKTQVENPWLNLGKNLLMDIGTGALEEADLRLGSAMPLTLQIARIPLRPGRHTVKIDVLDMQGRETANFAEQAVNVKKGEKVFIFAPALR
jgi:hypothetical protein